MPEDGPTGKDGGFEYKKGDWRPDWPNLLLPFLAVFMLLYRFAKEHVDWRAAFCVVGLFECVVFPAEIFSVHRGHWVYNEARIWGPRVFGVPIEEPLLYYLFCPLIIITVMQAIRLALVKWEEKGR
ncbi:MAG: lycopene cyclase domain-containing protein [Elusimicrobiota bacterium]|jgi:lycopene cyclase domain-containing protein